MKRYLFEITIICLGLSTPAAMAQAHERPFLFTRVQSYDNYDIYRLDTPPAPFRFREDSINSQASNENESPADLPNLEFSLSETEHARLHKHRQATAQAASDSLANMSKTQTFDLVRTGRTIARPVAISIIQEAPLGPGSRWLQDQAAEFLASDGQQYIVIDSKEYERLGLPVRFIGRFGPERRTFEVNHRDDLTQIEYHLGIQHEPQERTYASGSQIQINRRTKLAIDGSITKRTDGQIKKAHGYLIYEF